jgi:hypothetical protein
LDDIFQTFVFSLTASLGKAFGGAIVELVIKKFPFNEDSCFPAESSEQAPRGPNTR